jgi:cytoskeletal protein RodZ
MNETQRLRKYIDMINEILSETDTEVPTAPSTSTSSTTPPATTASSSSTTTPSTTTAPSTPSTPSTTSNPAHASTYYNATGASATPSSFGSPSISNQNKPATGQLVGGNRQLSYKQPIDDAGKYNVSLGIGRPYMKDLTGKDNSALLTVGGNPGNKNNFVGAQIAQPFSSGGQNQGKPSAQLVYRKKF